jgi:hypothetical protein
VEDVPLAVCDARAVSRSDLIEVNNVHPISQRRNLLAKYNENFRFYYLSKMTKDEVCVFKVFDSEDGKAKCKSHHASDDIYSERLLKACTDFALLGVPHASFRHQDLKSPDLPPRESIEVRFLILSEHGTTNHAGSGGDCE